MSVQNHPKPHPSAIPEERAPRCSSFFKSIKEQERMDKMPCSQYCKEKSSAVSGKVFKACVEECQWFQRQSRFSRLPS